MKYTQPCLLIRIRQAARLSRLCHGSRGEAILQFARSLLPSHGFIPYNPILDDRYMERTERRCFRAGIVWRLEGTAEDQKKK